jgi:hypothetical protein
MTSEKCETYLYLTLDVLGRTKKNMHLLELPSPGYNIINNIYYKYVPFLSMINMKLPR